MRSFFTLKIVFVVLLMLTVAPAILAETAKKLGKGKSSAAKSESKKSSAPESKTSTATATPAAAPATETPAAPATNTEPMGANDRISFMETESAQQAQDSGSISTGGLIFKTLGAMLLVVGLLFFGAWGLKKVGFGGLKAGATPETPELTILSSVTVGNGRTISSVKFGNRTLLVGSTAQSFTLLADGPDDELFPAAAAPRSVAEMLAAEEAEESFRTEFNKADALLESWNGGQA